MKKIPSNLIEFQIKIHYKSILCKALMQNHKAGCKCLILAFTIYDFYTIPIYNRNATKLADDLRNNWKKRVYWLKLLLLTTGSEEKTLLEKNAALGQKGILEICGVNRGRSIIRNQLAKAAKYETLFLDCDSEIDNPSFIATYLKHIDSDVVYGGTHYILQKMSGKGLCI